MAEAIPAAKRKCTYKRDEWNCPFDAEEGHDLCIFRLPIDKKKPEDFWRHMASYLDALSEHAITESPFRAEFAPNRSKLADTRDPALREYYYAPTGAANPWQFTGFVFPGMDEEHNFQKFIFGAANFANAEFNGRSDFGDATFSGMATFFRAKFAAEARFVEATFRGGAEFYDAVFNGNADFPSATFKGKASFRRATFSGEANFFDATFSGEAHFVEATFSGKAFYFEATFSVEAHFHSARINDAVYFGYATFSGPVYLSGATVNALLDFAHTRLRNRLLFEGTLFDDKARVLLWDLDFVHGTSDIAMEERGFRSQRISQAVTTTKQERWKGSLVEPAGQVVFRDISAGMNRVSFLHTDILTDRLLVRFSNVKWETDPKQFIFDARFAFCQDAAKWQEVTGLPMDTIATLRGLFHTGQEHPSEEPKEQLEQREAQELADCMPLVKQDVERIAREIRLSYEKYGHYGDAGDYYIAEMDFRRKRTPWLRRHFPELTSERRWWRRAWKRLTGFLSSLSYRLALESYRFSSHYGESPGRALTSMLIGLTGFCFAFVIAGFRFMDQAVDRDLRFVWAERGATIQDMLLAFRMALANLMPGNLRGDVLGLQLTSPATKTWAVLQVIITYILLTLLLLAIRRRFRR